MAHAICPGRLRSALQPPHSAFLSLTCASILLSSTATLIRPLRVVKLLSGQTSLGDKGRCEEDARETLRDHHVPEVYIALLSCSFSASFSLEGRVLTYHLSSLSFTLSSLQIL